MMSTRLADDILGVIAPHPPIMVSAVGGHDADVTRASADAMGVAAQLVEGFDPDTIVLMSPHAPAAPDAFIIDDAPHFSGSLAEFRAPQVRIDAPGDPALAHEIVTTLRAATDAAIVLRSEIAPHTAGKLTHGEIVPLSFIDPHGRWPLVVLSLSWLDYPAHRALGVAVAQAALNLGRRIVFLASGDCSHRLTRDAPAGYAPRAAEFDAQLQSRIASGDLAGLMDIDPQLIEEAGECGLRSFIALGGVIPDARVRLLSYEGPWGVGYLTAVAAPAQTVERLSATDIFETSTPMRGRKAGAGGHDESPHVRLARATIRAYILERRVVDEFSDYPELLDMRAGAFVSLHRQHDLRGCIGTIAPTRASLAQEIAGNAVDAATRDPRFPALEAAELDDLEISVDVLHPPEPIGGLESLDPARYGVIVTSGWRRGLLLPDLEGVDSAREQVSIAARKAGITDSETITLERFLVDRYR